MATTRKKDVGGGPNSFRGGKKTYGVKTRVSASILSQEKRLGLSG